MRAKIIATLALAFLCLAVRAGHAQTSSAPLNPPPVPGFVSSYEIMRTLRAAGFDPLAPPLREGTIYVARATDYRGILMRVVLDARTGAIRDANRIVSARGDDEAIYGEGNAPGPYGPALDGTKFYEPSPQGRGGMEPLPYEQAPKGNSPRVPLTHSAIAPPLPRPRPPELASRNPVASVAPAAAVDPKPESKPQAGKTPAAEPDTKTATMPAAPAPAPPSNVPSTLTINN